MKKVYQKYGAEGVEFVGISLDDAVEKAQRFVKANQVSGFRPLTACQVRRAEKYGVAAIPSVWVVGRDGVVISDDARAGPGSDHREGPRGPRLGPAAGRPK